MKSYDSSILKDAPASFKSCNYKGKEMQNASFTIQVSPEDCTGCGLCVQTCPAKSKQDPKVKAINMESYVENRKSEVEAWNFFFDRS